MTPSEGAPPTPGAPRARPAEAALSALFQAARAARARAYSPYSGIAVGAALLDASGGIHGGCNVENASYGLSMCAERVALGRAVGDGVRQLLAVAIVSTRPEPLSPCGACRQVLSELAPWLWVASEGAGGERRVWRLDELLPEAFGLRPQAFGQRSGEPGG